MAVNPSLLNADQGFGSSGPDYTSNTSPAQQATLQGSIAAGTAQQKAFQNQQSLMGGAYQQQSDLLSRQLAGQQAGYNTQRDIANIQATASELPAQLQQQRLGQVFPLLSGQLQTAQAGINQKADLSGEPNISAAPVWNDQQIQQQVNQSRAGNDQATASKQRQLTGNLAGRGFGGNSPLSQALGVGMQNQNLATNTANEQSTRWNAAQGNATQVLAGQKAQEGQFASRQQEAIGRSQIYQGYLSSALGALSGLV